MSTRVTGGIAALPKDAATVREAARLTTDVLPPLERPPTKTGFTNAQQAALYNSRKARRQRLGVVPQPPLTP